MDGTPLCNACGLYAAKNDVARPAALWKQDKSPYGLSSGMAAGNAQQLQVQQQLAQRQAMAYGGAGMYQVPHYAQQQRSPLPPLPAAAPQAAAWQSHAAATPSVAPSGLPAMATRPPSAPLPAFASAPALAPGGQVYAQVATPAQALAMQQMLMVSMATQGGALPHSMQACPSTPCVRLPAQRSDAAAAQEVQTAMMAQQQALQAAYQQQGAAAAVPAAGQPQASINMASLHITPQAAGQPVAMPLQYSQESGAVPPPAQAQPVMMTQAMYAAMLQQQQAMQGHVHAVALAAAVPVPGYVQRPSAGGLPPLTAGKGPAPSVPRGLPPLSLSSPPQSLHSMALASASAAALLEAADAPLTVASDGLCAGAQLGGDAGAAAAHAPPGGSWAPARNGRSHRTRTASVRS